jgi:release factor glutamine methyltransferase
MRTEQCYNDFLRQLSSLYENREAATITDWVFENIAGLKRMDRSVNRKAELGKDTTQKLDSCLVELLTHKPVQYILNEAWFYKMKFYVDENVLIPRPETEELVEWIVWDIRSLRSEMQNSELRILDIGTGSGCIAISIKKELENCEVTAVDVSKKALFVAGKNADALHTQINFLQIDFLNESFWHNLSVYDIIVSNPPYIPQREANIMERNVTGFEPEVALFVTDNNPFIFYEKIIKFAEKHLISNGKIYVENHENYSKEVQQIFLKNNFQTEIRKDIFGKERMIRATRNVTFK